jgi:hypothetical protein
MGERLHLRGKRVYSQWVEGVYELLAARKPRPMFLKVVGRYIPNASIGFCLRPMWGLDVLM